MGSIVLTMRIFMESTQLSGDFGQAWIQTGVDRSQLVYNEVWDQDEVRKLTK
ncbi:MAG: hypothetical protein IPJ39_18465 [Saprospiraceae bacterium]|nr:hypothetical protein [Saprospiraceae bacterium]